jgi:hypothetical protein
MTEFSPSSITEPIKNITSYDDIFSINSFLRGITNMLTPLLFGFIASIMNMESIYCIMAVVASVAVLPVPAMTKSCPAS